MDIKTVSDGDKSCLITLSGSISSLFKPQTVLVFSRLKGSPSRLRFDSVLFAIQEKMGFNLWWVNDEDVKKWKLIIPLESRGYFDFEKLGALHSPDDAMGIGLSAFKNTETQMTFLLMLDFTKQ